VQNLLRVFGSIILKPAFQEYFALHFPPNNKNFFTSIVQMRPVYKMYFSAKVAVTVLKFCCHQKLFHHIQTKIEFPFASHIDQ
jgi:hypothetical protein